MKRIFILALAFSLAAMPLLTCAETYAADWSGVDETVVEKFAAEAGREPASPLINTDSGDLLLFVFLLAGTAGGFVAGYCFRALFHEKTQAAGSS